MLDYDIWRDPAYVPTLRAYAIDPHNIDLVRGEIDGLQQEGSITWGYDSDTRVSAQISVLDPYFPEGSWIRLIADKPDGSKDELGTFAISHIQREFVGEGSVLVTYDLQSVLWSISEDKAPRHYGIGSGVKTQNAFAAVCNTCGKKYKFIPGCKNTTIGSNIVYEVDDSLLTILYDLADRSTNRVGCDGHGRITLGAYTAPKSRQADVAIDERDSRSIVLDDSLTEDDSSGEAFNRTIVHYKGRPEGSDNDVEILASSDVGSTDSISSGQRGFTRAKVHSVSEMSPVTQARANQLVNTYLADDRDRNILRDRKIMWIPMYYDTNIVEWTDKQGKKSKWLARTVDGNFADWTMSLTMKKVV